jgi:hypothetical protein
MPHSAVDGKNRKFFPVLVFVLAFLNFCTTIGFKFLWDDVFLISRINDVTAHEGVLGLLTAKFLLVGGSHYYRPLVLLSLWFNMALAGWVGWFAHLTNVLLHCTVALFAYFFLVKIASSNRAAMIGALIFALHPAHVETVAFVSGRTDLMAGVFLLPAALFWYKFVKSGGSRHFLLSLAFFPRR